MLAAGISKPLIFVVISFLVMGTLGLSYSTDAIAVPPVDVSNCRNYYGNYWECCWTEIEEGDPEKIEIYLCQTCTIESGVVDCDDPYPQPARTTGEDIVPGDTGVLEKPPTPQPFDPTAPLQGGVFEQPPTLPPSGPAAPLQGGVLEQPQQGEGAAPGFLPGFLERQQLQPPPAEQGAAELPPPATEETEPATAEEEQPMPVCQEGLEFNEDLGFCVPTECPEGQELNEETGICVLEEEQPAAAEEPQEEAEPEEEQPSEESDSEEDNGSN